MRRVIEPGSQAEEDIATSVLYGLIHGILVMSEDAISSQFNYHGDELERATPEQQANNQYFTGLVIHMASGDYRVKIERETTT